MGRLYGFEKIALWVIGILFVFGLFAKALSGMEGETGAVLVFFLFVGACLALTYWGWSGAIRILLGQQRDQQERQNVRDEIDARALRKLREEEGLGPRGEARAEPPRQPLPRWNETADEYESRRGGQRRDGISNLEGYEAGNSGSYDGTAGEARSRPAGGEGFPEQVQQRHCTNCGVPARAGDRFCAACGEELLASG